MSMTERYTWKAVVALIAIIIACVYFSAKELRYMIWGRTVDATVISAIEERVTKTQGGISFPQLTVAYAFQDGGQAREEVDAVTPDWPITKTTKVVAVEYIPGTELSRLKGNDHKGWLWGSGVMLVLGCMVGGAWWKFRDA